MSYADFKRKVNDIKNRSGVSTNVRFYFDIFHGKYIARFADGTTIIGCPSNLKVTVKWFNKHVSMAAI